MHKNRFFEFFSKEQETTGPFFLCMRPLTQNRPLRQIGASLFRPLLFVAPLRFYARKSRDLPFLPPRLMKTESPSASVDAQQPCQGADCGEKAKLFCPTCMKLGLAKTYFCSQDCFKKNWATHKKVHGDQPASSFSYVAVAVMSVCGLMHVLLRKWSFQPLSQPPLYRSFASSLPAFAST